MFYKKPLYHNTERICAKKYPKQELSIRIYAYNIYYCQIKNNPEAKELIYFEDELTYYPVLNKT